MFLPAEIDDMDEPDLALDVSGTLCPIPVVRARQMLGGMAPGQVLEVIATDPLAELDLAVMCERTGHEWVMAETVNGRVRARIRAAGPDQSSAARSR